MTEFHAWPKIPRLNRDCIVTEKLDGTNAAVLIEDVTNQAVLKDVEDNWKGDLQVNPAPCAIVQTDSALLALYAQSRKRFIAPGNDNYGFAAWVRENAEELTRLGPGRHFGEWWGQGIQRNYGMDHKRFSLFNSGRWHDAETNGVGEATCPSCCYVVPVVALGNRIDAAAQAGLEILQEEGSQAAPGFNDPEGIIVYHTAGRTSFKVTFDQDELPKSIAQAAEATA